MAASATATTEFVHITFTYAGGERQAFSTEFAVGWTQDSVRNVIVAHLMAQHIGRQIVPEKIRILSAKRLSTVAPLTPGV